jgi:AcrR family transcriptional regulator
MSRIAEGVGIRQASLYTHFKSRRDILLAALDVVYEKIYASRETITAENSLGRLREMCDHHLELWAAQRERHHAHLLLEFIAGARSEGLAEVLAEKHLRSLEQFTEVVEEGKKDGRIPDYVDPSQVAWLITGWAFAGDVAHQMGFESFFDPNIVVYWLDVIFASFAAPPSEDRVASAKTGAVCA